MTISFWMQEEHISAAKSVGAIPQVGSLNACGLLVGDYISFPGFRPMTFRVVSRIYRQGVTDHSEPEWMLQIEPAVSPLESA